jgi:type II secretion system protein D
MEGDRVALQFPNNPVADMLSIYELLTGITLIKDTAIFEGAPVSLATPRAVPKEEAVKLIEAALLTNGYAIVMEPDGKSAKILPARSQNANSVQFSHGVRFYTSAADLPAGETIVTYFMRLDFLDPEQAAQMFSGHVGLSVYGRITPVLTPPGLLITESSTVVKQLISIREAIDLGDTGSTLVTKFIPVRFADAATIAQIVQATLTAQAQEKESKGVNTIRGSAGGDGRSERREERQDSNAQQRAPQPIFINGQMVQPGNAQAPQPTAQVVADTRLNQILVVSSPADYAYIASLIAEFDKPLLVEVPYERKLKYASAIDVLSAIVDLLQDASGGAIQLPGGGTLQQQRQQPLASSSSQLLTGRNTQNTRGGQILASTGGATTGDTATSATTSGLGTRADVIQGPTEDNAPISVLVNKTRVVADPMSNSILVMGRAEDAEKVDGLLEKLDRKPAQVYLATVIGQLTLGDEFQFGIDYLTALNRNGNDTNFSGSSFVARDGTNDALFLGGNATTRAIRDIRNNIITAPFGPTKGLNLYGAIGDSLEVFVTALEGTNKFKILSRPAVFTLNNKKASITSGTIIPVPGDTTVTNNNVVTGINYRDVVLKLEVVPLINPNGEVSLTVSQVNDTVVGSRVVNLNEIPVIGTQQLITTVTVPSGKTIVLGGLIMDQQQKDTEGIPFLSRIPGVGNLFKENVDSKSRSELLIFIQPRVVNNDFELYHASASEDYRTTVGAEASAMFPGVVDSKSAPLGTVEPPPEKRGFFSRMFRRSPRPAPPEPAPSLRR